jgi:hypothetical protein
MDLLCCFKHNKPDLKSELGGYIFNYKKPCIVELELSNLLMEKINDKIILKFYVDDQIKSATAIVIGKDIETNKIYIIPETEIIFPKGKLDIHDII